jgi:nucleoside-diphosphate-sugar epimerase
VPRALVTGATGLVGSHIVDHLLADGWAVRALVRRPTPELSLRGVDVFVGDVLDAGSFAQAAAGTDVVFHTAAVVTARSGGWEAFRANVEGTRNAIDAAERAGARLMHLSSVAVYARRYENPSERVDEDAPLGALPSSAYYPRSKRESEDLVFEAHARGRIWATAVRPCVIYGTRDRQFIPRIARTLRRGVAPVIGSGTTTLPIVNAANVAQGALLAAKHDAAGGRAYNLANDFDVTLRQLYHYAEVAFERRIHTFTIPLGLAKTAFRTWLRIVRVLGATIVSSGAIEMVSRDNPYTSARARAELGWKPRVRPEQGCVDAFRWWRDHQETTKGAT